MAAGFQRVSCQLGNGGSITSGDRMRQNQKNAHVRIDFPASAVRQVSPLSTPVLLGLRVRAL